MTRPVNVLMLKLHCHVKLNSAINHLKFIFKNKPHFGVRYMQLKHSFFIITPKSNIASELEPKENTETESSESWFGF